MKQQRRTFSIFILFYCRSPSSLLFIPNNQPSDSFNKYGQKQDQIKLYVSTEGELQDCVYCKHLFFCLFHQTNKICWRIVMMTVSMKVMILTLMMMMTVMTMSVVSLVLLVYSDACLVQVKPPKPPHHRC